MIFDDSSSFVAAKHYTNTQGSHATLESLYTKIILAAEREASLRIFPLFATALHGFHFHEVVHLRRHGSHRYAES
jgi:hypothetical protein